MKLRVIYKTAITSIPSSAHAVTVKASGPSRRRRLLAGHAPHHEPNHPRAPCFRPKPLSLATPRACHASTTLGRATRRQTPSPARRRCAPAPPASLHAWAIAPRRPRELVLIPSSAQVRFLLSFSDLELELSRAQAAPLRSAPAPAFPRRPAAIPRALGRLASPRTCSTPPRAGPSPCSCSRGTAARHQRHRPCSQWSSTLRPLPDQANSPTGSPTRR